MKICLLALALVPTLAFADVDARQSISTDAAIVMSLRPIALTATLQRLGSGWDALARRGLPVPPAVNPFDPMLISSLGIDPAARAWGAIRALRGGAHLRIAVPLVSERIAEALMQSAARAIGIELTRGPQAGWSGRAHRGQPVVARLDGQLLVLDTLLFGTATSPAELQRIVPLHPAKPFATDRGVALRMGPTDAVAIWADLAAATALGIALEKHGEHEHLSPKDLLACQTTLRTAPKIFDDALLALSVGGSEELRLELSFGGKPAALQPMRGSSTDARLTRSLTAAMGEADLRVAILEPILPRLWAWPGHPHLDARAKCSEPIDILRLLRGWPVALASPRNDKVPSQQLNQILALICGLRGAVASIPRAGKDAATGGMPLRQLVALGELDASARGGLDAALAGSFPPVAPLKLSTREVSAYGVQALPWSTGEGPLLVTDQIPEPPHGSLLGFGPRELLRSVLERVVPVPAVPTSEVAATLDVSKQGLSRLQRLLDLDRAALSMFDGVLGVGAELRVEAARVGLEAKIALRPPGERAP